ncbi:hypothetical protein ACFL1S_06025, partial [Pseudomonadota bacterium]
KSRRTGVAQYYGSFRKTGQTGLLKYLYSWGTRETSLDIKSNGVGVQRIAVVEKRVQGLQRSADVVGPYTLIYFYISITCLHLPLLAYHRISPFFTIFV